MKKCSIIIKQMWLNLLFAFLPFVLVILVFLTYLFQKEENEYKSTLLNDSRNVATTLNLTTSNMENTSVFLIAEPNVRNFMLCEENSLNYTVVHQQVIDTLRRLPYKVKSYQYVVLLSDKGNTVSTGIQNVDSRTEITEEERRKADRMTGQSFWSSSETQLSVCRKLRDMYDVRKGLGYIKVGIAKQEFDKIVSLSENNYYLLMDSENLLIDNMNSLGKEFLQENELDYKNLVGQKETSFLARFGDKNVFVTPMLLDDGETLFLNIVEDNRHYIELMNLLIILTLFFGMLLSLLQLYFSKKWITNPLDKLGKLMSAIESENFSVRFHVKGNDEISFLTKQFNLMCEKLEFLYKEVYQNELSLKEAELRTLQAEMHPHFLFNTLNAVYWTIKAQKYEEASGMVMDLSQMFQYSLSRSKNGLVPLESEIQHMMSYLRLQKSRLQEKLTYSIDIQNNLGHLLVMKLVLQPLVENAIFHGNLAKSNRGIMSISIFISDSILYYTIYDNGPAADFDRIQSILNAKEDPRMNSGHGSALYNINRRLKLKFGEEAGIICSLPEDGGTMFIVKQSVIMRKEDVEDEKTFDR